MTNASSITAVSAFRDSLGCSVSQLEDDRRIDGAGMTFYRKKAAAAPSEQVSTPATNRGYLIGLSQAGGHRRRIFREHHSSVHDFSENAVYLRSFQDAYRADLEGSFDFVLLEIGQSAIERMAYGADLSGVSELLARGEEPDPVLGGLMGALFATTGDNVERSALFVDQLSVAIGIHVMQRYGNARQGAARVMRGRRISPRCLSTVREMMRSRLEGDLAIAELADACNLSEGAFLRAFRETVGKTPSQFLLQQRVERARDLLDASPLSISEIATACGFADQSHFTRVFSRVVGTSPGAWRRSRSS
ncbi:helix-turn-helix domain-containing protein [Shinella sp.]|uniref:helix-turn-helix domain-containing protein n=1 Tax=Shinella sp. TaxID=1870904 RepID=UPI003F71364D